MKIAVLMITLLTVPSAALAQTEGRGQRAMAMADANGDGSISLEEFQVVRLRQFDQADANSDLHLSPEEITAMQQGRQGARSVTAAPDPMRLDTDGDGRVGREEFVAAGPSAYQRLDRNGDGRIDRSDRG